ncbi:type IV pili methyl-accepting chemotaxis transducer N-terminal domain-containing protein [Sulfurovum sp.]|uniref:type IV pili methyl-accepting chemotaxis transducer N-terminal domain-containing protein n=1 Tax=Sulfurovum sp. TaxID=1969726 RepID=UPI0025EF1555|nr:type IV pili methyl-accepting chemotaxis transducer N-terminal domain-containing protein [Sulfurovum sp.]
MRDFMAEKKGMFLKGFVLFSMISTFACAVEIANATQAVDTAGKQRMYTQRMLKDYAMIGMGNTYGKPEEDLQKTIGAFEDHLAALLKYTKKAETKKSLQTVQTLWVPIRQILSEKPSKEKVGTLQKDLDKLLKASNETTILFTKDSGKKSGEIVNIAGRQRMLSQRMASLYMLKVWGVDDPKFRKKLGDAMKLFGTSLKTLESSPLTTKEIALLLKKVQRSFKYFEMMNQSNTTKFIPTLIYKKSDDMLKDMNKATQLYVANETK